MKKKPVRLILVVMSSASDNVRLSTDASSRSTPRLQYKDVFILSWLEFREDTPILKVLSEAGVPVKVMSHSDVENVEGAHSDIVWAAKEEMVRGLKRKVVVVIDNNDDSKNELAEARQRAMSRCTSQLVLVCLSGDDPD